MRSGLSMTPAPPRCFSLFLDDCDPAFDFDRRKFYASAAMSAKSLRS
jgi:hypothetical protein